MESSGTVQVAVLRSGNTEEQNVVTVHSRASESSASGLLFPKEVCFACRKAHSSIELDERLQNSGRPSMKPWVGIT